MTDELTTGIEPGWTGTLRELGEHVSETKRERLHDGDYDLDKRVEVTGRNVRAVDLLAPEFMEVDEDDHYRELPEQ